MTNDRMLRPPPPENRTPSLDSEIQQYVQSFTVSSDRVRHLILISIVASVLAFGAYRNSLPIESLPSNWLDTRALKARIAYRNTLWDRPQERIKICRKQGPAAAGFVDPCHLVAENAIWVIARRHGEASLKAHLEKLEHLRAEGNLLVSVPWLGIHFDINDLGAFSAISFFLLSMTLCFAVARQHENLYLCLWKVRRIADREERCHDGESKANFLYHALAMAQVFTRPPTLARWRPHFVSALVVRSLLFVPLLVQSLILASNLSSFKVARDINGRAAALSLGIQILFSLLLLGCTLACCAFSRVSDRRWRHTFFTINPHLRNCARASWMDWMRLGRQPNWGFAVDTTGNLYVGQPFDREEPSGSQRSWRAWKLSREDKSLSAVPRPSLLPECVRKVLDEDGSEYRFKPSTADRAILILVRVTGEHVWPLAGGKEETLDGAGTEAGFSRAQALVHDAKRRCLYAIDGACLRRIDPESREVKTLGGNPLGGQPRSLWPRLLGLCLDGERLLVADYDYGCVRALHCDGSDAGKIWRSRRLWSPAGVAAHGGSVYILEHRSLTVLGTLCGFAGSWARVWSIPAPGPGEGGTAGPRLLLRISRGGARLA